MLIYLLWIVIGYLCGSLPTAYLFAKRLKGIDIRQYGSGNVGAANIGKHVGKRQMLVVGLIDVLKAVIPILICRLITGNSLSIMACAALGVIAGHCWSLYLGFYGGRGMSTTLGVLLLLQPFAAIYLILVHIIGGVFFKQAAPADILALATMPIVAWLSGSNAAIILVTAAMFILISIKRLEANRLPLPQDSVQRRQVLIRRLISDRDVSAKEMWTERTPENNKEGQP